jgi:hypothetical protein
MSIIQPIYGTKELIGRWTTGSFRITDFSHVDKPSIAPAILSTLRISGSVPGEIPDQY